jgi:hypothetical protein
VPEAVAKEGDGQCVASYVGQYNLALYSKVRGEVSQMEEVAKMS